MASGPAAGATFVSALRAWPGRIFGERSPVASAAGGWHLQANAVSLWVHLRVLRGRRGGRSGCCTHKLRPDCIGASLEGATPGGRVGASTHPRDAAQRLRQTARLGWGEAGDDALRTAGRALLTQTGSSRTFLRLAPPGRMSERIGSMGVSDGTLVRRIHDGASTKSRHIIAAPSAR